MQDNATPTTLPRLGLTQGDFNGISYEIMLKTFSDARLFESFNPVLYGQSKVFSYYKKNFGMDNPNYSLTRDARQAWDKKFNIINIVENELKIDPGQPSEISAEMSVLSMKRAFDDLQNGYIDGLLMAPDSPAMSKSNMAFLLSHYAEADPVRVMVNDTMRIALATGDMPLGEALAQIDIRFLVGKMSTLSAALKKDFGLNAPKIAVMGINPHSGCRPEGDDDKVVKAVGDAQKKGIYAFGPFGGTQLFVSGLWTKYDAVLAMYYDQAVLPLRMMTTGGCAAYWAGLPVVCAEPLHGPSFEMANQNKAQPDDYRKAAFLAVDVIQHRREQ
ncbi:MAG: 4-hydroxythreonine-4-phosphate dehydrogenase PdxA [Bacteroidales bacterium]|nr:4-hydroxythreonine-4-phosphate dehydrogenase PdxA [Bacteroidales bacterium]